MIKKTTDYRQQTRDARGFSLTEVLMAVGMLAVGMLFVAGAFPVSIYFTTVGTERTIAPTVADEAFAKIRLYGISSSIPYSEFAYPSTPTTDPNTKQYWWDYISQRTDVNEYRVTVFVSRKVGVSTSRPAAANVGVTGTAGNYDIAITGDKTYINDGSTIVEDANGVIYRVLERYPGNVTYPNNDTIIKLDRAWQGGSSVWVVPPTPNGGRNPCIGVYQQIMRF